MRRISPVQFATEPFRKLDQEAALLVSGRERPNPMTISWGGFGTLWNKPVVTAYVRRTRHTFACLEEALEFTVCFLPPALRQALDVCGSRSGRDLDKWRAAGIEPEPSAHLSVPRVKGAALVFECKVLASVDLGPERMLEPALLSLYPTQDWHRVYFGEVLGLFESEA